MGGVQDGRDAPLPDREFAFLSDIVAAPVYSRGALLRLVAQTAKPGIACEFGVFGGASLRQIRNFRKPPVFGFDSWQGLPETWDIADGIQHEAGHFACAKPADLATGVHLVEGWFIETIPQWLAENDGPVQLLHIDCDLYGSAIEVLFGLNERLPVGAILLFDELCNLDCGFYENWRDGEWKALHEWLDECGRQVKPIGRTESQQVAFLITE